MTHTLLWQLGAAFGAGVLSSLSPCVYPMIPISVGFFGSQEGGRQRPVLLFFIGQVLTFAALGVAAVKLGEIFGFSHELRSVNIVIGAVCVLFGTASLFNYFPTLGHRWNQFHSRFTKLEKSSVLLPFAVGAGSALLASPCTSPILGTVLVTLSQSGTFEQGVLLMIAYSLGISLLFLALGLGLMRLNRLPRAGRWMNYVHKSSSSLIAGLGFYYLYLGMI